MGKKCTHIVDGVECGVRAIHGDKCIRHINQSCVICQEDVTTRNTFSTRRLKCGHAYHTTCLMNWLSTDGYDPTCPTCREDISDMDLVVFKTKVEDNMRARYKDALESNDLEIQRLQTTIELLRIARR